MDGEFPVTRPDLAALIGSRICHDLISPIGAIGNGVELLSMSGAAGGAELALISDSVTNANARIRFFRIAFGQASEGQSIGRSEVAAILSDLYGGARLNVDWAPSDDCPRRAVKVAFLLIQCLESSMPYGGEIRVTRGDGSWHVTGEAAKMKPNPALWALACGETGVEVTPSHVHFALVPEALARIGRRLTMESDAGRIALAF
jgi:histidine phosphotransferase ChpT